MSLQHVQLKFEGEFIDHYFLCHYHSQGHGSDGLSKSLLRFKSGWPIDVTAWTDCSVAEFKRMSIKPEVLLIRALGSEELVIRNQDTPLDRLGKSLALEFNAGYLPSLLKKVRVTKRVKMLSRAEREEEMTDVYQFKSEGIEISGVMIVDDILTTGSTIKSIIKAIRACHPRCRISVFTLAYSEHYSPLNSTLALQGLEYAWVPPTGWIVEEDMHYYMTLDSLKVNILNNFIAPAL